MQPVPTQGPPPGMPPFIRVPAPGQGPSQGPAQPFSALIRQALDDVRQAVAADDASEQERLIAMKMQQLGQQLLATHEREHQAALGGGPATNFLRRVSGS